MSLLLAIDTATDQVGLALFDGERLSELIWPARQRQTATVLQALDDLLGLSERTITDVQAVAVTTGPGSFSGLRVGMSVAKGLVLARDVALVGVSTLLVTAAPHVSSRARALAVVGAGRGRLVWAVVEDGTPEPVVTGEPAVGSPADLATFVAALDGPVVICGEVPDERREAWADDPRITVPRMADRRPGALARIGRDRWRRGEIDDSTLLAPTYLHPRISG